MASSKYPNNACCSYVSWENVQLTGALFLIENLAFLIIWAYDLEILTLLTHFAIYYSIFASIKHLVPSLCSSCCSEKDCKSTTEKLFIFTYDTINSSFDKFRQRTKGTKALEMVIFLYFLHLLNLSLFCLSWLIAIWSFLEPGLIKFADVNLRELCHSICHNESISAQFKYLSSLIPRASIVAKQD